MLSVEETVVDELVQKGKLKEVRIKDGVERISRATVKEYLNNADGKNEIHPRRLWLLFWVAAMIVFFGQLFILGAQTKIENYMASGFVIWFILGNIGAGIIFFLVAIFCKDKKNFSGKMPFIYREMWGLLLIYIFIGTIPILYDVYLAGGNGKKNTAATSTTYPTPSSFPTTKIQKNSVKTAGGVASSNNNIECIGPDGKQFNTTMAECEKLNKAWGKPVDYMTNCQIGGNCPKETRRIKKSECDNGTCCQIGSAWVFYTSVSKCKQDQASARGSSGGSGGTVNYPTSSQNTSPKVAFQATETTSKGTYYCYDNKVNSMVSLQSLVKVERELYENCKSSESNKNTFSQCWKETCSGLSDTSACSSVCYDKAYASCADYYKTYSENLSKLNSMLWSNCP